MPEATTSTQQVSSLESVFDRKHKKKALHSKKMLLGDAK